MSMAIFNSKLLNYQRVIKNNRNVVIGWWIILCRHGQWTLFETSKNHQADAAPSRHNGIHPRVEENALYVFGPVTKKKNLPK